MAQASSTLSESKKELLKGMMFLGSVESHGSGGFYLVGEQQRAFQGRMVLMSVRLTVLCCDYQLESLEGEFEIRQIADVLFFRPREMRWCLSREGGVDVRLVTGSSNFCFVG